MRFLLLPGRNPGPYTGQGTNTYLLPGLVPTLIDAGAGRQQHVDEIAVALDEAAGTSRAPLAQVLVTHAHVDHIGGAPALAARWPDARFAKWPWPGRDDEFGARWDTILDNDVVAAGDSSLWAIHTPGHSPDHLCFFEPRSGMLFAGDLVLSDGTVVIPASHGGSLAAYLDSLRRLLELQPRIILPGHGRTIDQPAALLRGYLAHRVSRERQIVDCLARDPLPVSAIVEQIYGGVSHELLGAAAENVLAHLNKLRDEGRAIEESAGPGPGLWRLVGGSS